ncbi:MAG TPA: tRNA 4-thiouridine(8) synthase ThiI, partial [Thermoplasmata archaeon]|nr:tRNA 4-thiouridine(8) synthase ThiI [Thermoplasmata archaeon]
MDKKVVIHYSEIGTKGKNRAFFEKKLAENIRKALKNQVKKVYRRYGRIVCDLKDESDLNSVKQKLTLMPGLSFFSFASSSLLNIDEIKKKALTLCESREFESFKVEAKRANKSFPLTSIGVNETVGNYLATNLEKKVKLREPELTLYIEILEREAYLYTEKLRGIGGLPVDTGGVLLSSLSGGIDSPVASFLLMKRGCRIVFVHVYNSTLTKKEVLKKLEKIVETLTKIQLNSKLYIVPFEEIQKEIIMKVPAKLRMLVYRRFMMRILNKIAPWEKAKGVVTGDSIGQVASQTIENLTCIYKASELPVLAPLMGMNKEEIVSLAKKIGSYNYSILPYPDCCSFMVAKHPETHAHLSEVE